MEAIKLKRIVIKEELYAITNDTIESIILGQFIYWQERVKDYDLFLKEEEARCLSNNTPFNANMTNGWIYKKASELIEECMLNVSENTIRRYISNLEEKGFISSRKNPNIKWDRTLQYRANMKFIIESIKNKGFDGLGVWNIKNKKNNYNRQLKSKEWKNFRKKVFKIKGKKCEICGSTKQLNIHHPFYTKGKLAWQYNPSDMMVLCRDCHKNIHNIK